MTERAPDLEERGAVLDREGRKAVPKVVQPHVGNARQSADLLPGAIDADERFVADRRREDVFAASFAALQDFKRRL